MAIITKSVNGILINTYVSADLVEKRWSEAARRASAKKRRDSALEGLQIAGGASQGASLGGMLGGPVGAAAGGVLGGLLNSSKEHQRKIGKKIAGVAHWVKKNQGKTVAAIGATALAASGLSRYGGHGAAVVREVNRLKKTPEYQNRTDLPSTPVVFARGVGNQARQDIDTVKNAAKKLVNSVNKEKPIQLGNIDVYLPKD